MFAIGAFSLWAGLMLPWASFSNMTVNILLDGDSMLSSVVRATIYSPRAVVRAKVDARRRIRIGPGTARARVRPATIRKARKESEQAINIEARRITIHIGWPGDR